MPEDSIVRVTMVESIPGPAYTIQTERLVIRCWQPKDASFLHVTLIQNIDHLRPWMNWAKYEPQELQSRIDLLRTWQGAFDLGNDFEYGIFTHGESELLGACGLHTRHGMDVRGIGYWIHKDHLNQGFATEASAALTRVAFEIDHVQRVEIHCDPQNYASAAIPRKLGFLHEATLHDRIEDGFGKRHDVMVWTLFAEDYPASQSAKVPGAAFDAIGRRITELHGAHVRS